MTEKDFELIEKNLNDALDYERKLNQQLVGRLAAYESIVNMMLKSLIDGATEKR